MQAQVPFSYKMPIKFTVRWQFSDSCQHTQNLIVRPKYNSGFDSNSKADDKNCITAIIQNVSLYNIHINHESQIPFL
jgi:hypothetical protein